MKKILPLTGIALLSFTLIWCGTHRETVVLPSPPAAPSVISCNGTPIGNVRSQLCAANQTGGITQECNASGVWETTKTDCKDQPVACDPKTVGEKVTFDDDIKPLIDDKCISCHKAIDLDEYGAAKGYADEIISRIQPLAPDTRRMPQPPRDPLLDKEVSLFEQWKKDGLLKDSSCSTGPTPGVKFITESDVRTSIVNTLKDQSAKDKLNSRFLDNSSRVNLGSSEEEKDTYKSAVNKAINAISKERDVIPCTEIDADKAVCRIDLDKLGLTAANWDLIVANAVMVIKDVTADGLFIQQQTGSKVPVLQGAQFVRAALDFRLAERKRLNPAGKDFINPYYAVLGIAADQKTYLATKGVDLQKIFDDFEAVCAGNNFSPISLFKNRLVCIVDSDDGDCSISFDPVLAINKSNLFQNPFVFVKSGKLFDFQASEVICSLENGGHEYSLWNGAGVRQDAAPENIVKNTNGQGGDTEIRLVTCNDCHSQGQIPVVDELRKRIIDNSKGLFNVDELDFGRLLYGPQGSIDSKISFHNSEFSIAMTRASVNTKTPDPITYAVNRYVNQWTLNDVCAAVKLELNDCKKKIDASRQLSDLSGNLTTGGTISFDLLVDTFGVWISELRLGQEPKERQ
jgi:hypothetical protein